MGRQHDPRHDLHHRHLLASSGVAKTASCLNFGAELAVAGRPALLIGMDPQVHLAESFGPITAELSMDFSQVLSLKVPLAQILQPVADRRGLAPSNIYEMQGSVHAR